MVHRWGSLRGWGKRCREWELWPGSSLPLAMFLHWIHPSPGHRDERENRNISHLSHTRPPFMKDLFLMIIFSQANCATELVLMSEVLLCLNKDILHSEEEKHRRCVNTSVPNRAMAYLI